MEADPVTTTREDAKELKISHSTVIWLLKKIEKMKKLDKWVPHELTANQKIIVLKCGFLLFYAAISQLDCNKQWKVDFIQQPAKWWDQEEVPKHFPKQTSTKKRSWSLFGCAASLIHYSFLNLHKTITSEKYAQQIDEMQWKLQHLQPALANRKGPILLHDNAQLPVAQPVLQKLNELGYNVLPHPPCSPDLSPMDYHFFNISITWCRGNVPTTRRKKILSKSLLNLEAWIFMLQE